MLSENLQVLCGFTGMKRTIFIGYRYRQVDEPTGALWKRGNVPDGQKQLRAGSRGTCTSQRVPDSPPFHDEAIDDDAVASGPSGRSPRPTVAGCRLHRRCCSYANDLYCICIKTDHLTNKGHWSLMYRKETAFAVKIPKRWAGHGQTCESTCLAAASGWPDCSIFLHKDPADLTGTINLSVNPSGWLCGWKEHRSHSIWRTRWAQMMDSIQVCHSVNTRLSVKKA